MKFATTMIQLLVLIGCACGNDDKDTTDASTNDVADASTNDVADASTNDVADASINACPNIKVGFAECTAGFTSMLVCGDNGEFEVPCRGPNGCRPSARGDVESCDQSLNEEGDRCALVTRCKCDPDGSQTLCCSDDGFFRPGVQCLNNSCVQADDSIIACDT